MKISGSTRIEDWTTEPQDWLPLDMIQPWIPGPKDAQALTEVDKVAGVLYAGMDRAVMLERLVRQFT